MKTYLEKFDSYGISMGGNLNEPSLEDRILKIDDLQEYINCKYAQYDVRKFGDTKPVYPDVFMNSNYKEENKGLFKLYGVFDGHCGSMASNYLKYAFPFELCGTEEFAKEAYKEALSKAFTNLHKKLISCKKYAPELSDCSFSSGSTASVALVTPFTTYFAFLGDSPILLWKNKQDKPELLFKEHSFENFSLHKKLLESNIFFTAYLEDEVEPYQVLAVGEKTRAELLQRLKKDYEAPQPVPASSNKYPMDILIDKEDKREKDKIYPDDLRVGFSKLNVLGSIGDSLYDVKVYNALIDEIEHYRSERQEAYNRIMEGLKHSEAQPKPAATIQDIHKFKFEFERHNITLKELCHINPDKFTYDSIRGFIMKQERWDKFLSKHIRLPESEDPSSLICSALMNFRFQHKLRTSGLKRQPEIIGVSNCDIKMFILATDGVIKYYNIFQNKYNEMIMKSERTLSKIVKTLTEYLSFLGDDRSIICCHY